MPVTYLKGAGAAIGRGAEAFEAQQGQDADSACSIEAAMQTGRYLPASVEPVLVKHVLFHLLWAVCLPLPPGHRFNAESG